MTETKPWVTMTDLTESSRDYFDSSMDLDADPDIEPGNGLCVVVPRQVGALSATLLNRRLWFMSKKSSSLSESCIGFVKSHLRAGPVR